MRKIRIICVGKTRDVYVDQGLAVFEKRMRRYCGFQSRIVKEADYSSGTKKQWLKVEAERLLKLTSAGNYTIVCDEKGKKFSSAEFAGEFVTWSNHGYSQFDFIIGGAYGLSDNVKQSANLIFSFSPMTMTHQIFRLILTEQIYRAFTIVNKEKYHHE